LIDDGIALSNFEFVIFKRLFIDDAFFVASYIFLIFSIFAYPIFNVTVAVLSEHFFIEYVLDSLIVAFIFTIPTESLLFVVLIYMIKSTLIIH